MSVWQAAALAGVGLAAGAASAMAGGATLLTFPVLLGLGLPPLEANVTNTTGLVPTAAGAALASRRELEGQLPSLALLAGPMLGGALAGAAALLLAPPGVFAALVPFLIAGSSVLLLGQPWIVARAGRHLVGRSRSGSLAAAFCAGAYAGYFGAAAAVLFMGLMGLFSTEAVHRLNAQKNVLIGGANAVAAALFAWVAPVHWGEAGVLACGTLAGGALGVRLARRLPPRELRNGIAILGLGIAAWLAVTGP